jgi:hypothetical protein
MDTDLTDFHVSVRIRVIRAIRVLSHVALNRCLMKIKLKAPAFEGCPFPPPRLSISIPTPTIHNLPSPPHSRAGGVVRLADALDIADGAANL